MKFERLEENLVAKMANLKAAAADTEIQTEISGSWTHDAWDYKKPPVTAASVY